MATIYDITFTKFATRMLPPDKRTTYLPAYLNQLLSPIQWLRDLWFGAYRTGATADVYAAGTTYKKYDQVIYNKQVYQSLQDANTGNQPDASAVWWSLIQKNFIGISERIGYTGQTLVLTYALNKWFGTTFVQPPGTSQIYITNNTIPIPVFRVGGVEKISSKVSNITSSEFIINSYSFSNNANFTIHCPVAVYNALDSLMVNNEKIFRSFVDSYVPSGLIYNIVTY